ncbi:guanylate kinase [Sanguibacter antarcticus]|uniref:guanylate kinase n=1 Tax=Sanguibacter antarcticus TaxID=372484 RepID=UPI001B80390C|nr:guanylate kinase [Sanguibacter antarcticus]
MAAPSHPDRPVAPGQPSQAARLTVLAGPTAVGKGTVSADIRARYPQVWLSVSATTRAPRPGEIDGVHYHFVGPDRFHEMVENDELLESAVVHGQNSYGTPRAAVDEQLAAGIPALLEIDLQGARQVRATMPGARFVFLAPPSWEELERRLVGRGTEGPEERERRLATARIELAAEPEFDVVVVNDDVHRATDEIMSVMGLTTERTATRV